MADVVLDISVLQSMFGDDAELCGAILAEFKHSSIPYMAEFDEAVSNSNIDGVKSLAHKLKSSSRTIGAGPLGDRCDELEQIAPQGNWDQINDFRERIRASLKEVMEAIDSR